jgi:hypothetical protein
MLMANERDIGTIWRADERANEHVKPRSALGLSCSRCGIEFKRDFNGDAVCD